MFYYVIAPRLFSASFLFISFFFVCFSAMLCQRRRCPFLSGRGVICVAWSSAYVFFRPRPDRYCLSLPKGKSSYLRQRCLPSRSGAWTNGDVGGTHVVPVSSSVSPSRTGVGHGRCHQQCLPFRGKTNAWIWRTENPLKPRVRLSRER